MTQAQGQAARRCKTGAPETGAGAPLDPWPATLRKPLLAAVFALGVSCVITQLALMREMLGVFAGNELVLGVVLGNWFLTMGLGAALGRWRARRPCTPEVSIFCLICTATLPPAQIMILRSLRQFLFLRGEAIGVTGTVLVSFAVLLPYCLCAGFFLAAACRALVHLGRAEGAGRVYAMDSLGSVAGGLLFSFILVLWLDHIELLTLPALLNVLVAVWLAWRTHLAADVRRRNSLEPPGQPPPPYVGGYKAFVVLLLIALGAGAIVWIVAADPDAASTARQFPGQQILFRGNSPYGRLVMTQTAGQTNVLENGLVLVSTPNIEAAEETAHFAMAQRPGSRRVLLVGGTPSGAPGEILRYPVNLLDCVELDPLIIRLSRYFPSAGLNDPRLRLLEADPRQCIRRAEPGTYDVVILSLPDPSTAQLNRLFTDEFFREVRRALRPDGVLCFAAGRYENYAGPELARLLSCARQTVAHSFQHVQLIPGLRVYFLASNGPLTTNVASGLDRAGVSPRWVTSHYLAAILAPDRLADVARAANQPAPLNRDFSPVLYYLHLRHWASQFEAGSRWLWVLAGLVVAGYVVRLRGAAAVVFASGYAGAAVEIVLLLAMQTVAGSVYRQVAWVVTVFMAGLAAGAWLATRHCSECCFQAVGHGNQLKAGFSTRNRQRILAVLAIAVAALAVFTAPLLPILSRLSLTVAGHVATQVLLLLVTFLLAAVVGAEFPLATALSPPVGNAAARLYTADFVGAALGALLTSCWLLPLAGVHGVCWISGGLNVLAALLLFRTRTSP